MKTKHLNGNKNEYQLLRISTQNSSMTHLIKKSKYILKLGTYMLSTWIKSITGHNNLAYFQFKLNLEIDPTCRLCLQPNENLHHLMRDCEATTSLQMDIMKNQIPLPNMTWSVKDINKFIQHPLIHSLMTHDTQYNNREI